MSTKAERCKRYYNRFNIIMNSDPIFFDTETTGVTSNDEAVELGIVDLSGKVLFYSRFKPHHKICKKAHEINGIFDEELVNAPRITAFETKLTDIFSSHVAIGFNKSFDYEMLKQAFFFNKNISNIFNTICTIPRLYANEYEYPDIQHLAKNFYNDCIAKRDEEITYRLSLYEASTIFAESEIENCSLHTGVGDANLTKACFIGMYKLSKKLAKVK